MPHPERKEVSEHANVLVLIEAEGSRNGGGIQ
jgi:hypothetical protein